MIDLIFYYLGNLISPVGSSPMSKFIYTLDIPLKGAKTNTFDIVWRCHKLENDAFDISIGNKKKAQNKHYFYA